MRNSTANGIWRFFHVQPSQQAERRTRGREGPGSKLAWANWFFFLAAYWAEPSPLFAHRARSSPLNCKHEYLALVLGEETAHQAVKCSRRLKNSRRREMSARGYALHSVCPQHSFFLFLAKDLINMRNLYRIGSSVHRVLFTT